MSAGEGTAVVARPAAGGPGGSALTFGQAPALTFGQAPARPRPRESSPPQRGARLIGSRVRPAIRAWGIEAAVLLAIAVALPVAIAVHYRSIGVPNSDDWAFDLAAFHLVSHGGIDLYHWDPSNLVGQLFMAAPFLLLFGSHVWVLNVWTCFMGYAGLVALCYLGRQLGLSRRQALFSAACLGLGPMWASVSTSFMLDVPAVSVMTVALAVAAGDRRTDRILTARSASALILAGVAFTTRDETVIALAAIAWCRLWRAGRPSLRASLPWLGVSAAVGGALLAFLAWRLGVPTGGHAYPNHPPSLQWSQYQWLLPLAGLMLVPAALAIRPVRTVRTAYRSLGWPMAAVWAVLPGLPVGYYLLQASREAASRGHNLEDVLALLAPRFGDAYFDLSGYAPAGGHHFLPYWLIDLLAVASVMAAVVIVAAGLQAVERWTQRLHAAPSLPSHERYVATMLGAVVLGSWFIYAVGIGWDLQAWDRYLFPLVAYVPMLALYVRRGRGGPSTPRESRALPRPAVVGLGLMAVLSAVVTFQVDGFVGSDWAFSNHFARTVTVPRSRIYTFWVWTAMQNRYMVDSEPTYNMIPGYQPCYMQQTDVAPAPGQLAFARGGSWVQPHTYAIVRAPGSGKQPACRGG